MVTITEVNDGNFEQEVLKSEKPVVVDFWAPWCAPCVKMAPEFEELAKELSEKIKFCKLNVDGNHETANSNEIRGIPCLVLFRAGNEIGRIVGFHSKDNLKEKIGSHLADLY